MENLGAYLQKLREDNKISYGKVFEDLRLREDQVRLIEENRFFELGPFGMVKAMVFKYARYLEGDEDAVLAELRVMMPDTTNKDFKPRKEVRERKILLSPNFFWLIGIIIFVVVLGAILWHAYQQGWLKTPELFKAKEPDSTRVEAEKKEPPKPDSLRLRQRELIDTVTKPAAEQPESATPRAQALADTTDYLGNQGVFPGQYNP